MVAERGEIVKREEGLFPDIPTLTNFHEKEYPCKRRMN
jgi:hypothetical protein